MRIAFVTSEYPSELPDAGGLGTYVHRMAKLLLASGHDAEVFVSSREVSSSTEYDGVPLHRVEWRRNHPFFSFLYRGSAKLLRSETWRASGHWAGQAWALARALERRHAASPFQLVQSADYLAPGLFVRRRSDRVHAVRCSTAADLYAAFDGNNSAREALRARLERRAMRRADVVYAPSRFVADHLARVHGINVRVLRPPVFLECSPAASPPVALPRRFLLHFGQFMERKGTALLAQALPLAWESAPDLVMVWSGRCWDQRKLEQWRAGWGGRKDQVVITGPLAKPDLYAVLQRAEAAVLPSQVDNLPNTVIESLMFGIPVLGTRGASIDELVVDGYAGHLVPPGDVGALADALARQWQGLSSARKGFDWNFGLAEEMRPDRAVANLLALASSTAAEPNAQLALAR